MNAAVQLARDIGPERTYQTRLTYGYDEDEPSAVNVRVTYRVDYPSVFHRGRGAEPDLQLVATYVEYNAEWKREHLPDFLYLLLERRIEAHVTPED